MAGFGLVKEIEVKVEVDADGMVTLTYELMDAGRTVNGAWTEKQLAALGTRFTDNKGWLTRLIGTKVTKAAYTEFVRIGKLKRKK